MTFKEIKELLSLVAELDLKEVKLKNGEFSINIRTDKDQIVASPSMMSSPMMASPQVAAQALAPLTDQVPASLAPQSSGSGDSADSNYITVKSPMVGTFYRSASPDKPPYIQVGDNIGKGTVLCIIEAMKLFNEIESEVSGKIVKVLTDDSSPVEYDQPLFLVDPNG